MKQLYEEGYEIYLLCNQLIQNNTNMLLLYSYKIVIISNQGRLEISENNDQKKDKKRKDFISKIKNLANNV
jgi:hypothetical protein